MASTIRFREPAVEGLVSCVVPVYQGERFLGEALDSILAQGYEPLEVVVVDDGSTDGTPEVATGYGDRIRYIRQANAGPAAARNRGVEASRGEFVAFLDADDLWVPEKTALQVRALRERPELDYCVGHVRNFWMDELAEEADRFRDSVRSRPMAGYVTGTLLARRSLFGQEVGLFDSGLAHGDATDWFLRCRARGVGGELLPDVLLLRRLHERNRSRVLADRSRDEFLRLLKEQLDRRRAVE